MTQPDEQCTHNHQERPDSKRTQSDRHSDATSRIQCFVKGIPMGGKQKPRAR
jgi:hypothetical protein